MCGRPNGEQACPRTLGARILISSSHPKVPWDQRDWPSVQLEFELERLRACSALPPALGAWTRRKRLWPGAGAFFVRLWKRRLLGVISERSGCESCNSVPLSSSEPEVGNVPRASRESSARSSRVARAL